MADYTVQVSNHAIDQGCNRCPDLRRMYREDGRVAVIKAMSREVTNALLHGRRAVTQPRWLVFHPGGGQPGGRGKRSKAVGGTTRYVWNREETRAYVITKIGPASWLIKTTLGRAG